MAASPYFDRTYFDSTYFDTDQATTSGRGAAKTIRLIPFTPPPDPVQIEDEELLALD